METAKRVHWVQESGPIGRLGWGAFAVGVGAILGAFWVFTVVGRYADWPDEGRRAGGLILMGLGVAWLCWGRLQRGYYVRLEASVGPEGIRAERVRYRKPASETERGVGRPMRHEDVPWERIRSVVVRRDECGTTVRHIMQVQYRLGRGGGGTSLRMPDAETAERVVAILRGHLPAKAVRVHRMVWPTERQGWWLAGLSAVWMTVAMWIIVRWGYRPDVHNWWTMVVVLGCGPGIPWAIAVTKGRVWRSPLAIVGMVMSNVWTNMLAGVLVGVVRVMMEIRAG